MKNNDFTSDAILPKLIRFMLPVLFAMFLQATYGAVDLLVVGKFCTNADVSGVSTGSQIIMTLTNLLVSFSMGITVAVGQKIGEKRPDEAAGMIGTGNIAPGGITLSTGTVMALATMCGTPTPKSCGCAMHYGFLPDTYVMLPVMESGGACLDWFRRTCMNNLDYDTLNAELLKAPETGLLFLPYLVGTNAPEFDREATGVFFGLRQEHTDVQMAKAVMEGVCFVLRKNCV